MQSAECKVKRAQRFAIVSATWRVGRVVMHRGANAAGVERRSEVRILYPPFSKVLRTEC